MLFLYASLYGLVEEQPDVVERAAAVLVLEGADEHAAPPGGRRNRTA